MDEIVQYYIVNSELNMSPGKVAAQVAHVATMIAIKYYNLDSFKKWFSNYEQKKIILRGRQKDLERLLNELPDFVVGIKDSGYTEIPAGSLTVVGFKPMYKGAVYPYIKRFQLY